MKRLREGKTTINRSIGASAEAINAAAEIKVRAERRMGEALRDAEKARGGRPSEKTPSDELGVSSATLAELGVSYSQSSRWQALASIPEDAFDAALEAHKKLDEPVKPA